MSKVIDPVEYETAVESLFERHQSVQNVGFGPQAYKPGLDAMIRFDEELGCPSKKFRSVHVAGTNGKGSVCTMLASSLAVEGRKIGLYTSPHLLDFRERIKLVSADGYEMISREEVMDFISAYESRMDGLSFFEVTTGMAFWWFERKKVDFAVIETGLGGRLDSTNIIMPDLTVITSIGLDHCTILGDTREKIAGEKAGIFKAGVPAVVWGKDSQTSVVFEKVAAGKGAALYYADGCGNDSVVRTSLEILGEPYSFCGLSEASERTGFRGRWERIGNAILDIGHNPQALARNFARLEALDSEPVLVYGVMADKDYRSVIRLMPAKAKLFLASPDTPRALNPDVLARAVRDIRPELEMESMPSVKEAVCKALESANGHLVYIGGSTFVVSEAIQYFENDKIQQ